MTNLSRWQALWHTLEAERVDASLFTQLQQRYTEPHRAYHTLAHIEACLREFDGVSALCERPAEVEAAIWFHDVIYDPHRSDNEERSAAWALSALAEAGVAAPVRLRVDQLILATKHTMPPAGQDASLLVDIDLSFLGCKPAVFEQHQQQIQQEYRWVPELVFRAQRAEILRKFLARPRIYQTEPFHKRFEQQARQNLTHALGQLRG
jgi:predicted metal-dependent HD superfamily phosphohydrolase